jgi:hypothetical protein
MRLPEILAATELVGSFSLRAGDFMRRSRKRATAGSIDRHRVTMASF